MAEAWEPALSADLSLVSFSTVQTRHEVKLALSECIEVFPSRKCRHSTLGHLCPAAYERVVVSQVAGSEVNLSTEPGQAHDLPSRSIDTPR